MLQKKGLVWFKNDLRLHDNQTFATAVQDCAAVLPVFIIDPRWSESTVYGFKKTGAIRMQFIYESVLALQTSLRELGSNLFIYYGLPETIIPKLVIKHGITDVYTKQEFGCDEVELNNKIHKLVTTFRKKFHTFNTNTLFNVQQDVINHDSHFNHFANFRTYVLENCQVPQLVDYPTKIQTMECLDSEDISVFNKYINTKNTITNSKTNHTFKGGEKSALVHLHTFFTDNEIADYEQTKTYSTKFSAWFAQGCLSVRTAYQQIIQQQQLNPNQMLYTNLINDLIWRDYYYYQFAKYGKHFFKQGGMHNKQLACIKDYTTLTQWINAQTSDDFINASMMELQATGWINHQSRQAVVDYLSKQLLVDWRIGGAYFESQLIDYDVCQNYGNWARKVGVGADVTDNGKTVAISENRQEYVDMWLK